MNNAPQYLFCLVFVLSAVAPATTYADWWIVRSADERCLVVDIEPTTQNDVTRVGKDKYGSVREAEADANAFAASMTAGPLTNRLPRSGVICVL